MIHYPPLADTVPVVALLARAMGLQGASVARFGSTGLNTVVVTATIARLAEGLAGWMWPARPADDKATTGWAAAISLAPWTEYGIGAAAAVMLLDHVRLRAPLIAQALLVAVVAITLVKARASPG